MPLLDLLPPVFSQENEGAFQNPFHNDIVIRRRDTEAQKYKKGFKIIYEALMGRRDPHVQNRWYQIPKKTKLGLFDYGLTIPIEALSLATVGVAFVAGVLAPYALLIALFVLACTGGARNRDGSFLSGFFTGMLFANMFNFLNPWSNNRGENIPANIWLGVMVAALAFLVLYPIRLGIQGVEWLLSVSIAAIASPFYYLARKASEWCNPHPHDPREEAPYERHAHGYRRIIQDIPGAILAGQHPHLPPPYAPIAPQQQNHLNNQPPPAYEALDPYPRPVLA